MADRPRATRRATIYDVAARAGVSKSLVSLVLQNSPKVSAERRQAVEAAMVELDYRPSRAATALAGSRSRTIGVVIDDFRNLWFVDLLDGLREVLGPAGLTLTVADLAGESASSEADPGRAVIDGFVASAVDALVVACEPTPALLRPQGFPVVVAGNRSATPPDAAVVSSDDSAGAEIAVRHLLDLGHRRIAHLTGGGGASALRLAAYERVLHDVGLTPHVASGFGRTNEPDGYEAARRILREAPDTTALFAGNDTMALGALAAIREAGLDVPAGMSLMGFDNSPIADARILRLTTVDSENREVGRRAAQTVVDRLAGARVHRRQLVSPRLVLRDSTAPPRG
ncbi:LacI family DNA-binding transcriptional regulator [Frondihabitans australicus]|uniref:LacI family transcriptional regulator n=1 Tax=Frondihabitans australicus TaxID=386892 RepID=A0A495IGY1_9MICO|nr:LacI family DNA-binding transcriptional regulator [Frondihabitans australicus]RKR75224.1 LacI family transcriptional regulator [Frondihabitans australicus]